MTSRVISRRGSSAVEGNRGWEGQSKHRPTQLVERDRRLSHLKVVHVGRSVKRREVACCRYGTTRHFLIESSVTGSGYGSFFFPFFFA